MRPLGVDGCRGGWLAVEAIPSDWSASVCSRLDELDANQARAEADKKTGKLASRGTKVAGK